MPLHDTSQKQYLKSVLAKIADVALWITILILPLALLCIVALYVRFAWSIWGPNIFAKSQPVLASAQSQSGERFRITQHWNGGDGYVTQLEQFSSDGTQHICVLDGDDKRHMSGSLQVVEAEKKVIVALPDGLLPLDYRWNESRLF